MHSRLVWLLAAAAACSRADAQPAPAGATPALYDLDTAAQPAPGANSALDRVIRSLHVRVCVRADVPPFSYFGPGGLTGFDVALAREIVDQISIDYKQALAPEWVVVTAAERTKRLQDDACDVLVASYSYTKERAAQVATSKVYARTDKVLLAAATLAHKPPVIAKLEGATGDVGVTGTVRSFRTYQEIVHAMDAGEIDYLATDRPIAEHLLRSTVKSYKIAKTLAAGAESYVAAVKPGNADLLAAVDRALETLARSGRLALLERRYL